MGGSDAVTRYVTSADGTRIGYLAQGSGPGVVLVQGAMADVHAYRRLAGALSSIFTVYRAERRGRGLSPRPYSPDHDIARDVEDIDAVLRVTSAGTVFGLSSGAVITLEAARTLERVRTAVVYEPPFYAGGLDQDGVRRLNAEIERGDLPAALLDSLLVAGTAPTVLRALPRSVSLAFAAGVLAADDIARRGRTRLRTLLPGVRFDFRDVAQRGGHLATYSDVDKPVLVLSGTASPAFLRLAARQLTDVLPRARHVQLPGLGHDGPWNTGRPDQVATAIRAFLSEAL